MASAFDVAAYLLEKCGSMTHMRLQKLVYYSQAWSLVWEERSLFGERIEAWANGPVVPALAAKLKGLFRVDKSNLGKGTAVNLTVAQRDTIDRVLDFYGERDAQWLSDLTHMEAPWVEARKGLALGERGQHEIGHASMAEYYSSL